MGFCRYESTGNAFERKILDTRRRFIHETEAFGKQYIVCKFKTVTVMELLKSIMVSVKFGHLLFLVFYYTSFFDKVLKLTQQLEIFKSFSLIYR